MKVWVEGKAGKEKVKKKLMACGFELCEHEPEIVVVWGGDGSILKMARKHPRSCLLGLREKSLGRLAEIDGRCLNYAVQRLMRNEYWIEEVSRIELSFKNLKVHGLNEVYFFREYEFATRFRVFIDGDDIYGDELFGDGCLAATSQGSTAYSWTAGKKIILSPNEKSFVFTPLSSGHLNKIIDVKGIPVAKPVEQLKVSDDKKVIVKILRSGKNKFVADGLDYLKTYVNLEKGDKIVFKKANETTKFIRFTSQ